MSTLKEQLLRAYRAVEADGIPDNFTVEQYAGYVLARNITWVDPRIYGKAIAELVAVASQEEGAEAIG